MATVQKQAHIQTTENFNTQKGPLSKKATSVPFQIIA